MSWMQNNSPMGQWVAAFGLGGIFGPSFGAPWVSFMILLAGVAIGIAHHFLHKVSE